MKRVMFRYCLFLMVVSTMLMGCAGPAVIYDISKVQYVKEGFGAEPLNSGGLALVPIVAGRGLESHLRKFGEALIFAIQSLRPELKLLKSEETISVLNERGLGEKFGSAIDRYRGTGLIDKGFLREIGEALGVRYLLFVSLEEVQKTRELNYDIFLGWRRRTIATASAFGRVLDCATGDVAWEGLGTAESKGGTERDYEEYCRIAAEGLACQLVK